VELAWFRIKTPRCALRGFGFQFQKRKPHPFSKNGRNAGILLDEKTMQSIVKTNSSTRRASRDLLDPDVRRDDGAFHVS
jgi:hypothetical protein